MLSLALHLLAVALAVQSAAPTANLIRSPVTEVHARADLTQFACGAYSNLATTASLSIIADPASFYTFSAITDLNGVRG